MTTVTTKTDDMIMQDIIKGFGRRLGAEILANAYIVLGRRPHIKGLQHAVNAVLYELRLKSAELPKDTVCNKKRKKGKYNYARNIEQVSFRLVGDYGNNGVINVPYDELVHGQDDDTCTILDNIALLEYRKALSRTNKRHLKTMLTVWTTTDDTIHDLMRNYATPFKAVQRQAKALSIAPATYLDVMCKIAQ